MARGAVARRLMSLALTFVVVWVGMVMYWRNAGAMPGGRDLLLYLGLLPTGLSGGLWMLQSWAGRLRSDAGTGDATDDASAATAEAAVATEVLPARGLILAAASRLPLAGGGEALAGAAAPPKPPGLHPTLRDHDGLPVLACHVPDLETDAVADAMRDAALAEEQLRAIALLGPVLDDLSRVALSCFVPIRQAEARVVAGLRRRAEEAVVDTVDIDVLLPAGWSVAARQAVGGWVADRVADGGLSSPQVRVTPCPVESVDAAWEHLQQVGTADVADDARRRWRMLVACDSSVSARCIMALASSGRLAGDRNPHGVIPGEGAAGILLAPDMGSAAEWRLLAPSPIAMHRTWQLEVEPSAARSVRTERARALAQSALAHAGEQLDSLGFVVSDAAFRPESLVEANLLASALAPESDAVARCLSPLSCVGQLGVATPLALLATAVAHVGTKQTAALVLRLDASPQRAAMVLAREPVADPKPDASDAPEASAA